MGSAAGSGPAGSGALDVGGLESALHLATRGVAGRASAGLGVLEGANGGTLLGPQSFSQPQDLGSYRQPQSWRLFAVQPRASFLISLTPFTHRFIGST